MPKHRISSLEELNAFTAKFLEQHASGCVLALSGELGAGKTTFVRSILEKLAKDEDKTPPKVASPSFVLHQSYLAYQRTVDHFDLYRLEGVTQSGLLEIGYYDAWERAKTHRGFVFVEWPEKAASLEDLKLDKFLKIHLGKDLSERQFEWVSA